MRRWWNYIDCDILCAGVNGGRGYLFGVSRVLHGSGFSVSD